MKPKQLILADGTTCCEEKCPYYFDPSWSGNPLCKINFEDLKPVDEVFETYLAHCNFYSLNQYLIDNESCGVCGELLNNNLCVCEYCGDVWCPF